MAQAQAESDARDAKHAAFVASQADNPSSRYYTGQWAPKGDGGMGTASPYDMYQSSLNDVLGTSAYDANGRLVYGTGLDMNQYQNALNTAQTGIDRQDPTLRVNSANFNPQDPYYTKTPALAKGTKGRKVMLSKFVAGDPQQPGVVNPEKVKLDHPVMGTVTPIKDPQTQYMERIDQAKQTLPPELFQRFMANLALGPNATPMMAYGSGGPLKAVNMKRLKARAG